MIVIAEIGKAFLTIAPSARGFGSSLNSQTAGPVRSAGTSLGKTFGKLFVAGASILAVAGVGHLLSGSIDEAREAQKVDAQTAAVIKSTGGAANVSAGQFGKLAASISAKIGVDDEAIQAGENMLATFTNVRNEVGKGNNIFTQATRTASDMAAAFGGDATSNSKILGKALNDPIKGVSALTRVGVSFTQGQKDQIKTLTDSGNILGAQKIVLRELGKETKGSAEAQATAGDKASVALGNLKETIGTALLPVIDRLANTFTNTIAPAITTFIGQLQSGEGVGGRVASVFSALGSVFSTVFGFIANNKAVVAAFVGTILTFTVAMAALNAVMALNPISLVVIALAALVAGLVYAYKHSEKFRAVVDTTFAFLRKFVPPVISYVVNFVKNHWRLLIAIIGGPLGIIVGFVIKHFDTIKKAVGAAADFVVASAKKYGEFVKAVISKVVEVVKFFHDLPGKIKGFVSRIPGQLEKAGGQMIEGLKRGIERAAHYVTDAVQAIINKIPKKIRELMHINSPSKVTQELGRYIGEGLALGIESTADKVGQAAEKLTKKVKEKVAKLRDTLSGLKQDFASLVDPIASAFTGNLFEAANAKDFVTSLMGTDGTLAGLKSAFKTLLAQGLNPKFLYDLFQSGNAGLILDLAKNPALATQAGGLFNDINQLSTELGQAVAGATPDGKAITSKIDVTNKKLDHLIKAVHNSARETGAEINGAAGAGHHRGKHGGRRAA